MTTEIKRYEPIRDLVEFSFVSVPVDGDPNSYDLNVELRIGSSEVDESGLSEAFTVRLRRVFIEMEYSGSKIVPGSKMGEPTKPNELTIKRTIKRESKTGVEASAGAKIGVELKENPSATFTAKAKASGDRSNSCVDESEGEIKVLRVKAIGNDRWNVAEIDGQPLDGKVVNNDRLCTFTKSDGSNAVLVAGRVIAKQKDFSFTFAKGFLPRLPPNEKKLLGVFLAKKLAMGTYSGEISLAELQTIL